MLIAVGLIIANQMPSSGVRTCGQQPVRRWIRWVGLVPAWSQAGRQVAPAGGPKCLSTVVYEPAYLVSLPFLDNRKRRWLLVGAGLAIVV
jgi:hypothetical protein